MPAKKYLIVIIGPTAIGKTNLSISLARHYHCEIISADSRQFYRGMNIGTAVPSAPELEAAPHHLIHNKELADTYTVGDFEKEAISIIADLHRKDDVVILVGGSGLYVDAVLKGIDSFPAVDPLIRETVTKNYEEFGISWLQEELEKLDPAYYEVVARQNPQRLMRALEVCIGSGKPYSSFLQNKAQTRNFIPIVIGLEADRSDMYDRINLRVEQMIAHGLAEEARNLYPLRHLNSLQTVGYRELFDYFENKYDMPTAVEEIKKNTRRFAKRQMTWFKRAPHTSWFHFLTPLDNIIRSIDNSMNNKAT